MPHSSEKEFQRLVCVCGFLKMILVRYKSPKNSVTFFLCSLILPLRRCLHQIDMNRYPKSFNCPFRSWKETVLSLPVITKVSVIEKFLLVHVWMCRSALRIDWPLRSTLPSALCWFSSCTFHLAIWMAKKNILCTPRFGLCLCLCVRLFYVMDGLLWHLRRKDICAQTLFLLLLCHHFWIAGKEESWKTIKS